MRVIVVGSGIAGLTAADALRCAGVEVVVLEARDRIGGRTWTLNSGEARIDLGGAWVHGPVGNPLAEALAQAGIGTRNYGSFGSGLSVWADGWVDAAAATTVAGTFTADWDPAQALSCAGSARFVDAVEWFIRDRELDGAAAKLARFALLSITGGLVAAGVPDRISLAGVAAYAEGAGGNLMPEGGFGAFAERLAAGLDIRLGSAATRVEHGTPEAIVHSATGTFEADAVVVTVPLGVLKAGTLELDPEPAGAQASAIERLAMGTLEKIVLQFEDRFWPSSTRQIVHLSSEDVFPFWCDLSPYAGAPTLVALYNPTLAAGASGRSSEQRIAAAIRTLQTMFGSVPDPSATIATDWARDRWALGSYSYVPLGATAADMARLAVPISDRLTLAGEATVADSYGTVHAAFRSGLRAAGQTLGERPARLSCGPVPAAWTV